VRLLTGPREPGLRLLLVGWIPLTLQHEAVRAALKVDALASRQSRSNHDSILWLPEVVNDLLSLVAIQPRVEAQNVGAARLLHQLVEVLSQEEGHILVVQE